MPEQQELFSKLNSQLVEKYTEYPRGSVDIVSIFSTLQGEGPFSGYPAVFIRTAGCNLQCLWCFHGSTLITMEDGKSKPISDVVVGDRVLSYSQKKKSFVFRSVTKVYHNETRVIYKVTAGSKKTFVTGEHPILVKGKGWVQAKSLQLGDIILHLNMSERRKLFNPMREPETVKRMQITTKERYGKHHELFNHTKEGMENKRKAAIKRMTESNPMKNPEVAIKGFLNRKDRGKMTSAEKFVNRLGANFRLCFVGDGSLVINHKVPDFIMEGTKKVVEVWDASQTKYLGRDSKWRKERKRIFEEAGYEVLFLPVTPYGFGPRFGTRKKKLKDLRHREICRVQHVLSEFYRNGLVVRGIEKITRKTNPKAWTRLAGQLNARLPVYNLEVEGTHTYIANSMIVHNCDTDYTSDRHVYTPIQVVDIVQEMRKRGLVVITGGEPFRQNISPLVRLLVNTGYHVQVETNGSLPLPPHFPGKNVTVVCSPKTPKIALERGQYHCLKYVITAGAVDADDGLPTAVLGMEVRPYRPEQGERTPIYVSPADEFNAEKNEDNLRAAIRSAMAFDYVVSEQSHKRWQLS